MIGHRKRSDEDFAQEILAHLELETDRLRGEGLGETEARASARRAFGNVTTAQERFYESGRLIWLEQLVQDLRYAARLLLKSPGFTAITVLTLAIGIGANTAMFSVVDACLLRSLPYPNSDRLITVWSHPPQGGHLGIAPGNFLDIQDQSRSFEHMGVLSQANFHLSAGEGAQQLSGFRVSADFLNALEMKPAMGRGFAPGEDRPGAAPVAILSHATWRSKFGGDPRILGRAITLDGRNCTVIGVMPEGFRFALSPELWTQLAIDPANAGRDIPNLLIFAKLKRGLSLKQATAELQGILGNLARAYPQAGLKGWSIDLVPWQEEMARYHRDSVGRTQPPPFARGRVVEVVNPVHSVLNLIGVGTGCRQHDQGLGVELPAEPEKFLRPEAVVVRAAAPDHVRVVSAGDVRADAVLPLVCGSKGAPGPTNEGRSKIAEGLKQVGAQHTVTTDVRAHHRDEVEKQCSTSLGCDLYRSLGVPHGTGEGIMGLLPARTYTPQKRYARSAGTVGRWWQFS
jgi:hypothetical protein